MLPEIIVHDSVRVLTSAQFSKSKQAKDAYRA